jgi:hypothetical protein
MILEKTYLKFSQKRSQLIMSSCTYGDQFFTVSIYAEYRAENNKHKIFILQITEISVYEKRIGTVININLAQGYLIHNGCTHI